MPWKANKKLVSQGLGDLEYLPRERCGWDNTLACLAFGMRMDIERRAPDLNAWAARHGVPPSAKYRDLGRDALVLWHGTSRERAGKIARHGLFHKRGLWTAIHPGIPHSFCRGRSERFATEGAVVCILLDRRELSEGRNFEVQGKGDNVIRFHHGLPADVVEYVLLREQIRFTGKHRARHPAPWPAPKFKKRSGAWVPIQKAPARYSHSASYSSAQQFAAICVDRLLEELVEVTALEIFSCVYAAATPWDALSHQEILDAIGEKCAPFRRRGKHKTFHACTSPEMSESKRRR